MAILARVLLIGNEQDHLATRAVVLQHFWRIGIAVADLTDDVELSADVIVVSETVPEGERQSWVHRVRQQSPAAVVVRMNGHPGGPHAGADATVDDAAGPGALVSTIYELLNERGLGSRGWPPAESSLVN